MEERKIYNKLQEVFLNLPVINENYVELNLETIEQEEYAKLYNCFMHIENGEINIKHFDIDNKQDIPINSGSFSHKPRVFKPSIFYKGIMNGRRYFMMEHYNLEYDKLVVNNGITENYVFYEEKGKELEVIYNGLKLNKIFNKKIKEVNIFDLEVAHIFIEDLSCVDMVLYISEMINIYQDKFNEINIIYPKQESQTDLEYVKEQLPNANFIDVSEGENFNNLISENDLLLFNDVATANAFTDYYQSNHVLILIHDNIEKMSQRDLAMISRISTIIESGEILFQASLTKLNQILPNVLNKGTYVYKTVNHESNKKNTNKITIRCTDATTSDLELIKMQLPEEKEQFEIDIIVDDKCIDFVKSTLNDRVYNFVNIKDYSLENTNVYINSSKNLKNDFLLWKAFDMGITIVSAKYHPYIKQMINAKLILDIEEADFKEKFQTVKERRENAIYKHELLENYVLTPKVPGHYSQKVFIYSTKIVDSMLELKLFYRGYEKAKYKFTVNTRVPFELDFNKDYRFYSAPAINYRENFMTLKLDMKDFRDNDYLEFICGDKILDIYLVHSGVNNFEYDEKIISIKDSNRFVVSIDDFENTPNTAKIFQDRRVKADDNAETLYEYCLENDYQDCYFVIDRDVPDYTRLVNKGFKVIEWGSPLHKDLYISGETVFSSHISSRIITPFRLSDPRMLKKRSKTIFLQHGQLFEDHQYFLNSIKNPLDMICVSSTRENNFVNGFSDYDNIVTTGLARHDKLMVPVEKEQNEILYFPTWNRTIDLDNVPESDYYKEITNLYKSEKINEFCKKNNLVLKVVFHMESQQYFDLSYEQSNVKLYSQEEIIFSELIRENLALITDVSSLMFDQAYLRKPIISYRPYSVHSFNSAINDIAENPQNIEEIITYLEKLMNREWKAEQKYIDGMEQFFDYADDSNSARIIEKYNELFGNSSCGSDL